mmetsp:Transcript_36849/g.49348  ORF Transcript_36849/g.49348 Transcript_36849/m.49348 type:complete len:82 (-) Transcript_36849:1525-1770(-)
MNHYSCLFVGLMTVVLFLPLLLTLTEINKEATTNAIPLVETFVTFCHCNTNDKIPDDTANTLELIKPRTIFRAIAINIVSL